VRFVGGGEERVAGACLSVARGDGYGVQMRIGAGGRIWEIRVVFGGLRGWWFVGFHTRRGRDWGFGGMDRRA
jgi:hypothetical protein